MWYNMQYIKMSGNLPMGIAVTVPRVRYSAAYPTGRERIKIGCWDFAMGSSST